MADEWTIGRLLQWTTDYLKQHGSASPGSTPRCCWPTPAAASGSSSTRASTNWRPRRCARAFRELVKRRAEGTPVAYLVGHREFYLARFRVTPDVLIPRPETEFLVMALLDRIKGRAGPAAVEVADVGTGSGIIAITVARQAPQARVTAIDISPAALAVARDNAERLQVAERIDFVESDLLRGCRPRAEVRLHRQQPTVRQRARNLPTCRAT